MEISFSPKGDDSSPVVERSENPLKIEPWHGMWYASLGAERKVLLEERDTNRYVVRNSVSQERKCIAADRAMNAV